MQLLVELNYFWAGIACYLIAINVVAFIVYGLDKLKARQGWWRISEFSLLLLAAVGGSLGAWLGMKVWHHKTQHRKFKYGVPLLLVLQLVLGVAVCVYGMRQRRMLRPAESCRLQQAVDSLLAAQPMDVGVAVRFRGKWLCAVHADTRFPMMSVFKLHQAVAVLDSLDSSPLSLDTPIRITRYMLRENTYSPLREAYPAGGVELSIGQLLRYSLLQSDNNACDILFSLFGGPRYVQAKMDNMGLHATQIKWNENEMHQDALRAADNVTTPREAIRLLEAAYRNPWLRSCLTECATGRNRLPGLLPPAGVRIGHKTGTGDVQSNGLLGGVNDIGFVEMSGGEPYFIAVFCNNSARTFQETEAVIAGISRVIYDFIRHSGPESYP